MQAELLFNVLPSENHAATIFFAVATATDHWSNPTDIMLARKQQLK